MTIDRLSIRTRTDAGMSASRASPSSPKWTSGSVGGPAGMNPSSTRATLREIAPAFATTPCRASSPTCWRTRGARPNTVAVTNTSSPRPSAGTRSSPSRFRATRKEDMSALPDPQDAADLHVGKLPPNEPDRHDEQDHRGEIDRGDRLPRDDHDRCRGRRRPGLGQRRERQHEPSEDDAKHRSREEPDREQEDALDRQPQRQLAGRQPQRAEERDLGDPLARRNGRTAQEADPREQHRGYGTEPEDADQSERDRVGRQAPGELVAADDGTRRGGGLAEPIEDGRGLPWIDAQPPLVGLASLAGTRELDRVVSREVGDDERHRGVERRELVCRGHDPDLDRDAEARDLEAVADRVAGLGEKRRRRDR